MATVVASRPTVSYALSDAARGRLETELSELSTERAIRASEAGSMTGDVADIAEFAARDMLLEQLDERIARIRSLLAESTQAPRSAVTLANVPADTVGAGAHVRLRIAGSEEDEEFVLGDRAEGADGVSAITLSSPLGRALIGAHVGDTIEYAAPVGTLRATVLELHNAQ